MGNPTPTLARRFSEKVEMVPFSTCHYWMGALNNQGYGMIGYNATETRLAHRVSYELENGPIPETTGNGSRTVVRHTCDTPMCVNPDHLILGSQVDNAQDAIDRNRGVGRPRVHTDATVRSIVEAIIAGEQVSSIAERFEVSVPFVSSVRHGKEYRDISAEMGMPEAQGRQDRRISSELAKLVYGRAWSGENRNIIAADCGVSAQSVSDIKRGATYAADTGHRR